MKKHYILLSIALSFFFLNDNHSQTNNEILAAELDAFIENRMTQFNIPGLSASIVKEGQVVWSAAYGVANIQANTPVSLETEFTLASISKLFTATAIIKLMENGIIDLDEDINSYLPITVINPNFPDIPITIRQLIQHKSSLKDSENDLQLWDNLGDPFIDLETFCSSYFVIGGDLYNPNNFANTSPGNSSYWYSNAGFTLLGYIVQVQSELPFNIYCRQNILQNLDMNSAAWFYANSDTNDLAMPYSGNLNPFGYYSVPEYPAAMLKANILELSNFLISITKFGKYNSEEIISPESFQLMLPENMNDGFAWWGSDTWYGDPNGNYWSHGGYMNGVRTQINYYPSDSSGLIILTNGEGNYLTIQNKIESYIPLFDADGSTSIKKYNSPEIRIFPNPISESRQLNIAFENSISEIINLEIINLQGSVIRNVSNIKSPFKMSTDGFSPGIYFIHLNTEMDQFTEKIIIE